MSHSENELAVKAQPSPQSSSVRMIFILGALAAFGPLSIDMYLPAFPDLSLELSAEASLIQLSLTACLLGIAIGQLFAGPVSDVIGRRKPLFTGLFLYALASFLCAFAQNIWTLIFLRFVQGLAGSAGIVISRAVVRDLYSGSEMTRFFSMLMLVNGMAPILAPVLGGQVLQVSSWRGVFLLLSVLGLCMLAAVFLGLKETLPGEKRSKGSLDTTLCTFKQLLKNRVFMGHALVQGFVSGAMFAYIAGSPFVFQDIFGVSPQLFSLFFALNSLGLIVAGQVTGRLAGRVREKTLLLIGLGMAVTGGILLLAMIVMGGGLVTIVPPLLLAVSSVGVVGPSSFSLAMQDQAKAAGSAAALIGLLSFIVGGLVAPLVGILGSHTALPMGLTIAVCEVAALLSYVLLVRKQATLS